MRTRLNCLWSVGPTDSPDQVPDRFVEARAPGAVQLDWARAQGWPPPEHSDSPRAYEWMEEKHWLYLCEADVPELADNQRLHFVCGGVDYAFQVRLSGRLIHEQEGMFTPVDIDLTDLWRSGVVLELLVLPAPKSQAEQASRDQANQSCKPAVSYGWDFHPRLIPLGIWRDAYLEIRPDCHLTSFETRYELAPDLKAATIRAEIDLHQGPTGNELHWTLADPDGQTIIEKQIPAAPEAVITTELRDIRLWWPNGQGDQPLYTSTVSLLDPAGDVLDSRSQRIGLRRVRLVNYPGQWDEIPAGQWPKGPNRVPITLEVNGRPIFAKGSNWVCPDMFPGRLEDDRLRGQLELARQAHLNFLRCWGGAALMPESFFDAADEMGILIWQEFPLSCNRYEGTDDYLRVLDQESRSIIRRLRSRACLAVWSGGNELFNKWSGMSMHDAAIRLLQHNTYRLDRDRPFLMTAPLWGMAHGPYRFCVSDGAESMSLFQQCEHTAYTEFGVFAAPSAESMRKWQSPDLLALPGLADGDEAPRGSLARRHWEPARYFRIETLDQFATAAGILQREGYKHLFEEIRRQKPVASMALNWCWNEPTPRTVNGSVIGWPDEIKPGYAGIRAACRPALASARIRKFTWRAGEHFQAELWLLNDAPDPAPAGEIRAVLVIGQTETLLAVWPHGQVPANTNLRGATVTMVLPDQGPGLFELVLRSDNDNLDSRYPLILGDLPVELPDPS